MAPGSSCIPFLAPGEQIGETSAFIQAETGHDCFKTMVVRLDRILSATVSATSGIARRNLFSCIGYDGSLTGLQSASAMMTATTAERRVLRGIAAEAV